MRSHFMLGVAACAAVGVGIPAAKAIPFALDTSSDPAYADGWQVGENGGFGFGPWNMDGTANTPVQHSMATSQYNQITPGGLAWTLFNPDAPPPGRPLEPNFDPNPNPPSSGTDISQAGRAILGGLQVGQTLSTIIDNPIERKFFRGYTVRLNTGGGNTVYAGTPVSRLAIGTFEYGTLGKWFAGGTGGDPNLFDTDTDSGLRIDVTLTGPDTFNLVMTPLENPALAFTKSGTLDGPAGSPIDWIEFELYNTDSDFFPGLASPGQAATDFYIRSIEVTGIPEPTSCIWLLAASAFAVRRRKRRLC